MDWFGGLSKLGMSFYQRSVAERQAKAAKKRAWETLRIERLYAEKEKDIELNQQLAVSRENLMSDMRTASDRSLNEVLRDYQFAEPQPTVYRLGPAKEPTFIERVNAFIEQIVTTLRL